MISVICFKSLIFQFLDQHYKGIVDCMVKVTRSDGFFALYKGLWPSIVGVVPYVGMDFATYETLKRYSPKQADGTVNGVITVTNGAMAGLVAQSGKYLFEFAF